MRNHPPLPFAAALAVLGFSLLIGGCAGYSLAPKKDTFVTVLPSDRLFLVVTPFDFTVRAELARAGLDPARVEEDLNAELRYQLALRRQEEAWDSAGATVVSTVTVRHLQPGAANAGTFAAFALGTKGEKETRNVEWTWRAPSKDNIPQAFAARHLSRRAAAEVMAHMKATRPKPREPAPPLVLIK